MYVKSFYSRDISYLDELVQNFIINKIVYDIQYEQFTRGWQADIFYDDILKESENESQ